MYDTVAFCRAGFAEQRQHADAVLTGTVRQGLADDLGECGHQIREADQFATLAARSNHARPTGNAWDAMAAVPDIGLVAAVETTGKMPRRL